MLSREFLSETSAEPRTTLPSHSRKTSPLYATNPRLKLHITLHLLSTILSLTSLSLFAIAIPKWNANFFHSSGPLEGDWTDGLCLAPLSLAVIFSVATLIKAAGRFCVRSPRQQHQYNNNHEQHHYQHYPHNQYNASTSTKNPAQTRIANSKPFGSKFTLYISTIQLLFLGTSLALAANGSLFRHWRGPAQRTQGGLLVCNLLNIFTRECEPVLYSVGELQLAGVVVGGLAWLCWLGVFLLAVLEVRIQRIEERRAKRRRARRREEERRRKRRRGVEEKPGSSGSLGSGGIPRDGTGEWYGSRAGDYYV